MSVQTSNSAPVVAIKNSLNSASPRMTDSRPLLSVPNSGELVLSSKETSNLSSPHNQYGATIALDVNEGSICSGGLKQEEEGEGGQELYYEMEMDDYTPWFCWITIGLNTLAFIVTMFVAEWHFMSLSDNPMLGPDPEVLDRLGAKDTAKLVDGEWWRLILPMYLHGGVFHLLINMFVLWRIGCDLERAFGWARVGSIYMLSGISGTLLSAIFVPQILGVGASGALFGLVGSLYGDLIQNWKSLAEGRNCYIIQLVLSTVVGLAVGLLPLLDNFAHVGGFVVGFFAGCVFLHNPVRTENVPFYSYFFFFFSILFLIVWFVASGVILFTGLNANELCSWCQYLSCVETPWWSCTPERLCYILNPDGSTTDVTCEPE